MHGAHGAASCDCDRHREGRSRRRSGNPEHDGLPIFGARDGIQAHIVCGLPRNGSPSLAAVRDSYELKNLSVDRGPARRRAAGSGQRRRPYVEDRDTRTAWVDDGSAYGGWPGGLVRRAAARSREHRNECHRQDTNPQPHHGLTVVRINLFPDALLSANIPGFEQPVPVPRQRVPQRAVEILSVHVSASCAPTAPVRSESTLLSHEGAHLHRSPTLRDQSKLLLHSCCPRAKWHP